MALSWIALVAALVLTAVGQMTFKLYFTDRKFSTLVAAVLLFISVPVCSYLALRNLGIGLVYMSTAATQILVLLLARVVLKEQLTRDHLIAVVLITAGVVLYAV